jgi:hypothetical protein
MKWEPGRGVGPKPETEPLWLDLGRAARNGNRGWCAGVVRQRIQGGGGGGGVVCSQNVRRGAGGPKKTETELPWLGFGLQWDCKRWRGVPWGYNPPPRAKLEEREGE